MHPASSGQAVVETGIRPVDEAKGRGFATKGDLGHQSAGSSLHGTPHIVYLTRDLRGRNEHRTYSDVPPDYGV